MRRSALAPVVIDGKQFAVSGERFDFRGVTYGTFEPREDGVRFPEHDEMKRDLVEMAGAGFTVVRTYTPPSEDLLELAAEQGLRVLAGIFYADWRYLHGSSRRRQRQVLRDARNEVRREATRLAGDPRVLAISVGNELPADVIRWVGTDRATSWIDSLAREVKACDPERLVTYANYPTAEYLTPRALDILTFNVFLEDQEAFRRYLTRLQNLAGDKPLILGEVGYDSGPDAEGEARQAAVLEWQLGTAIERGVAGTCIFSWTDQWWVGDAQVTGWHFGLTRADRAPKPALDVASRWNRLTVRDVDFNWPTMSIVICAYNAAPTLDECLRHTCALDYPSLEIIVVDDGSTDETAAIAARHERARLLRVPHAGLSVARNEGWVAARGELVVYLDSDAYPSPEWPWYLALAFDDPRVGAAGGPNVPPVGDVLGAAQVAQAPGGPVHVLITDDRAEHVPGCNMAFWRDVLHGIGGFDPVYLAAGDDVDACWKVLDAGWDIGFHPAALVWHHRRAGLRPYLRQQRGYGRSEALVEERHPDRFNSAGSARWRGRIYNPTLPALTRPRIYRGPFGAAPFQSVYQAGGHALDYAHQIGVPAALGLLVLATLGVVLPVLFVAGAIALALLIALGWFDAARARPPGRGLLESCRFRLGVAVMTLLQPVARTWGRTWARRSGEEVAVLDGANPPVRRVRGGLEALTGEDRSAFMTRVIAGIRRQGVRLVPGSGWDDADAHLLLSWAVEGVLVSSSYPEGTIQLAVRVRLRARRLGAAVGAAALLTFLSPWAAAIAGAFVVLAVAKGLWRRNLIVGRLAAVSDPYSRA